jgi:hypothetical protein
LVKFIAKRRNNVEISIAKLIAHIMIIIFTPVKGGGGIIEGDGVNEKKFS